MKDDENIIINWIRENFIGNYKIDFDENKEIVIHGNITLTNHLLKELPYKFKAVEGNFSIGGDKFSNQNRSNQHSITTLKNCPDIVHGDFNCALCPNLKSLQYGPQIVEGNYYCHNTGIKSLKGIAHTITGYIAAYANHNLINIEDAVNIEKFADIDLELCVDFLYAAPVYKQLLENKKITLKQKGNFINNQELTKQYLDTNNLH